MVDKRLLIAVLAALTLSGCAGSIERWIVDTRVHQGDVALSSGNAGDAVLAYSLALRVDGNDPHARSGFVEASADEAQLQYTHGHFDQALAIIADALKIDPASVRLDGLRSQIESAKLKQEIIISNYPMYQRAGQEIEQSYLRVNEADALLLKSLRRFGYSYDLSDLTAAIKQSYEMQLEVAHDTARLISYRQLVETGGPQAVQAPSTTGGSLLPLP